MTMTASERRILLGLQVRMKQLEDAYLVISQALQEVMESLESQVNTGVATGEEGRDIEAEPLDLVAGWPPRLRRVK